MQWNLDQQPISITGIVLNSKFATIATKDHNIIAQL